MADLRPFIRPSNSAEPAKLCVQIGGAVRYIDLDERTVARLLEDLTKENRQAVDDWHRYARPPRMAE